jgi:phenylacetate-CoA ligase
VSTLDERVVATVREAAARVPAFAERLRDAGLAPAAVRTVRDLDALPILTKDDVLALQRAHPPFGGLLAPDADVRRMFQSPGPIYEPQLAGPDPWRWQEALVAVGVTADDVLVNCFGYHLSPAGAMFEEASLALGATVLPGGVGNLDLQAQAVADLGVTAYAGLPSYLKALIERYDESGLERSRWQLGKALVTAEPLPDSLRALLTERVPVVRMAYGTAETGLLGYEVESGAGLVVPEGVLVQICDLDTGTPLDDGEGQVVVTLLRSDYPLVRFGTGDLSAWIPGADGRPRLAGVLGRVGAAVKVRGMFLHPRQIEAAMRDLAAVASYRFVVDRAEHRDELRCEVVPTLGADEARLIDEVRERVRSALRFDARVVAVRELSEGQGVVVDNRRW